ncbi:MAG: 23S rRNA (guanosine(2251)-2'-O)-methyltransferase RlmB [Deltaproteobacteria bacterium]|nr:23S rRNA (guanosine(2251)-2'-O)-methyltransferase RlmB [Deltaproteobacteria bacterium]
MLTIYGVHPVMEAIESGDGKIEKIVIAKERPGKDIQQIIGIASRQGIPVIFEDREYADGLARCRNHQGVICLIRKFQYTPIDNILSSPDEENDTRLILLLDCIEDPQNLGSLIRTGHCFGVKGVIIPEDRTSPVTPAVIKASAGSALHTPIARVVNIAKAIDRLQKEGFWIYGADAVSGSAFDSFDYEGSVGLVMGSEKKGIRPLVKKKCDFLISVPMSGRLDSLNVSVAAGIIIHEIASRKRHK